MKEQKLVQMKNKIDALTRVMQQLIKEIQTNASLIQGTLSAFQLHIGKEEWEKVVKQLQEKEQEFQQDQLNEVVKKEDKKLEIPEEEELPPSQRK